MLLWVQLLILIHLYVLFCFFFVSPQVACTKRISASCSLLCVCIPKGFQPPQHSYRLGYWSSCIPFRPAQDKEDGPPPAPVVFPTSQKVSVSQTQNPAPETQPACVKDTDNVVAMILGSDNGSRSAMSWASEDRPCLWVDVMGPWFWAVILGHAAPCLGNWGSAMPVSGVVGVLLSVSRRHKHTCTFKCTDIVW